MGVALLEEGIDISLMLNEINNAPEELWNLYPQRRHKASPHHQMTDIWLRFANINEYAPVDYGDMQNKPHESHWYDAISHLDSIKQFSHLLMSQLQGERLGGVIISRLPAGKSINSHVDSGWHADYYTKYHLLLQGNNTTIYSGNKFLTPAPGSLFVLDSSLQHGVINNGEEDRIALIVCIKTESEFRVGKP